MATLAAGHKTIRAAAADPWAAHNASEHIPGDRLLRSIQDAEKGLNLFGAFATGEEAVRAMLED